MNLKVGDKLLCTKTLKNFLGQDLFIEGNVYVVLNIINGSINGSIKGLVQLNHILYGSEYGWQDKEIIKKHFINIKEERRKKLEKLNDI